MRVKTNQLLPTAPQYKSALEAAREELTARLGEQRQINERIRWLQVTIASLEAMETGESDRASFLEATLGYDPNRGLTSACRNLLAFNPGRRFSPSEVVQQLQDIGFDFSRYTNPLTAVCTILTRLTPKEARITKTLQGQILYDWVGSQPPQGGF